MARGWVGGGWMIQTMIGEMAGDIGAVITHVARTVRTHGFSRPDTAAFMGLICAASKSMSENGSLALVYRGHWIDYA